ncbi:Gfo/Idh/MocA family oxidoreductase [Demequina capsici]|uniref:Gfo/Idh/MocA family oxidoreductase n=1 Tax=Demequina capsici TaxID=3075620 RepID=A0AA96JAB8_9MICO|nr:Gfo/Idh/MocA family oxidoreductase [Demequina sp. PMTSA13]WNM27270.1 Gfo/Idh/MocA family oxidoreductase [Demequina sp. PMTSA13]
MFTTVFPAPRLFAPGQGEPSLRWGVIGPGSIAGWFVSAMRTRTAQTVAAVSSRSLERAEEFAARHGIARAYGSTEQLLADPEIDVIYIAATQNEHVNLGLAAIAAGKHVLVEKPLAMTAAEAQTMVDAARAQGVLLMEAMWSRYQPKASVIRQLLADGVLGEIRHVHADHGQSLPAGHRLYRADLGGGALFDLGIYPVQLDSMVLGAPQSIHVTGAMTDSGVDAHATLVLGHGTAQSTLTTSMIARTPTTAVIAGSEACLALDGPFHVPADMVLTGNQFLGERHVWSDPTGVGLMDALCWEATALATYVGEQRLESPLHTHQETVSIIGTLEEALRQIRASA